MALTVGCHVLLAVIFPTTGRMNLVVWMFLARLLQTVAYLDLSIALHLAAWVWKIIVNQLVAYAQRPWSLCPAGRQAYGHTEFH